MISSQDKVTPIDSATMLEKWITNNSEPISSQEEPECFSPSDNERKIKRRKGISNLIKKTKERVFEDVTNTPSPSLKSTGLKKRKELLGEIALLTERITAMEDIQIINNNTVLSLTDKLQEKTTELEKLTKQYEEILQENSRMRAEIQSLKEENDRHVMNKWRTTFHA